MTDQWVTFEKMAGTDLVRLAGEIDMANAPAIGREIVAHTGASRSVLIDLTAVSFLDSAGVRLLDALVGELDGRQTPVLLVVGETGPARMTLRLCEFRDELLATDLDRAAGDLNR